MPNIAALLMREDPGPWSMWKNILLKLWHVKENCSLKHGKTENELRHCSLMVQSIPTDKSGGSLVRIQQCPPSKTKPGLSQRGFFISLTFRPVLARGREGREIKASEGGFCFAGSLNALDHEPRPDSYRDRGK
jgi:hypothetical protein